MSQKKTWKILELLNTTTSYFTEKRIENPRLNAERLLAKVLNLSRVELYVSYERPLTVAELNAFRGFVKRRSGREPLQYILGETEFMGLPFKVSPAVLIPRPETEILVEEILKLKEMYAAKKTLLIDVGSGSGCIPLSVAHFWKEAQCIGLDISQAAIDLARENTDINQLANQVDFINHNIFETWPDNVPAKVQILVSNPPYIAAAEMDGLQPEVACFEPRIALSDEADGLSFYKRLFELCRAEQAPDCDYLLVELSGSQPQRIIEMVADYGFNNIEIINDLNSIPRVLKVKVKNG